MPIMKIYIEIINQILLILGLDYRTLRDELQAGSRLPNPTYSTPKISHMIQTCWLADPIERPTFTKIRETLKQSGTTGFDPDHENRNEGYLTILPENNLRIQYKKIQECNPLYRNKDEIDTADNVVAFEPEFPTETSQYGSYPYLKVSTSVRTTITQLNSTSTYQHSILNYTIPRQSSVQSEKNEECPLNKEIRASNEVEMGDVF